MGRGLYWDADIEAWAYFLLDRDCRRDILRIPWDWLVHSSYTAKSEACRPIDRQL